MNAFEKTLREIRHGASLADLSEKLTELVAAVRATGKRGKLIYEISIEPASRGEGTTVLIQDDVKAKIPLAERGASIFFTTDENTLQRTDPRQPEFELKAVKNPNPEPVELSARTA